jgi:hypothetical protein
LEIRLFNSTRATKDKSERRQKEVARKLHVRDTRIAPEIMERCIFLITMEISGIEPEAYRLQSGRDTTTPYPLTNIYHPFGLIHVL